MSGPVTIQRHYGKPVNMHALKRTVAWRWETREKTERSSRQCSFEGQRASCPICSSAAMSSLVEVYGFEYAACDACGHVFYIPIVRFDDIKDIYAGENSYLKHYMADDMFMMRVEIISTPKVKYITDSVHRQDGAEWLDVGCGGCDILYAARQAGWSVRGIETGTAGVEQGKKLGIPVVDCFITDSNVQEFIGQPQLISFFGILEHLSNPLGLLKAATAAAKAGTSIAIEVPRHPSLSAFCTQCFPELSTRHIVPPQHIHIFTEKSLECLLDASGFEITHIWTYGQDFYETMSMMAMRANKETNIFPTALLDAVNDVQTALDKHGLSDIMLVIARKK